MNTRKQSGGELMKDLKAKQKAQRKEMREGQRGARQEQRGQNRVARKIDRSTKKTAKLDAKLKKLEGQEGRTKRKARLKKRRDKHYKIAYESHQKGGVSKKKLGGFKEDSFLEPPMPQIFDDYNI